MRVRALQLDTIILPPWQGSSKLKCLQARKNIVIKPAAQSRRIMTADLKRFSHLVTGAARTLDIGNRRNNLVSYLWFCCHIPYPFSLPFSPIDIAPAIFQAPALRAVITRGPTLPSFLFGTTVFATSLLAHVFSLCCGCFAVVLPHPRRGAALDLLHQL